jgi:hypothetical protein
MWQLYCMYGDDNKWTESYESYDEVCSRISDMKPELMELPSFLLIINDPDGTQVQSVSK